jgi:hypothetical protein
MNGKVPMQNPRELAILVILEFEMEPENIVDFCGLIC